MTQTSENTPPVTTSFATTNLGTTRYLRINQIIGPDGPLPISKSGFWKGVKDGKFPAPRKISSRVTVWRAEDIEQLLIRINQGAM